jgi:hypothetical protein
MTVDCGFCEHHKPSQYSFSPHAPRVCQKPVGRKCPKGYSFEGGRVYDMGILPYALSIYSAEEIWKNAVDITEVTFKPRVKEKKKIETMTHREK